MEFEYKVSVIVPTYNAEEFLPACFASLEEQTIDPSLVEVLLIVDGSPDNSLALCKKKAAENPMFKYFWKENEGLSKTRNFGIAHAKGKYILYLDPDDTLEPETLKNVTEFFDAHYDEIDVVTYPIIPIFNGERKGLHYRYRILEHTGVYDLDDIENVYINQTTINICVKNMGDRNVLFETQKGFRQEDQKYCLQIVLDKLKIGFCNEAAYLYRWNPGSATNTFFYAYYIFEPSMAYWEEMFDLYEEGKVPRYLQSMFFHDISWKNQKDILLPYHYDKAEFDKARGRVIRLLNQVEDAVILKHPTLDDAQKQYYIGLKNNNDIQIKQGVNSLAVLNHDAIICESEGIEVSVRKFRVHNGILTIRGELGGGVLDYLEKPQLLLLINRSETIDVDLRRSGHSYHKAKQLTNKYWFFDVDIDLAKTSVFLFKVKINGAFFACDYTFELSTPFNEEIDRGYGYFAEGKAIQFNEKNGSFTVEEIKTSKDKQKLQQNLKAQHGMFMGEKPRVWAARTAVLRNKAKHDIWLYYDCVGVEKDNGYHQFVHDLEQGDDIERYYILNEKKFAKAKQRYPKEIQKHIVQFGSKRHKWLFLRADKIITAYGERENYAPVKRRAYARYLDLCKQPEIVYLQHGVLHAHTPWKYSFDKMEIDREVISTGYEKDNLINNYAFREDGLICAGMPRYDFIEATGGKVGNRILFAPSWRNHLVSIKETERILHEDKFLDSEFYKETERFLNSKELEELLEKNNLELDFKLHPIFAGYKKLYKITNPRVHMDSNCKDEEYCAFITDFSSYCFDFVYLKKPILYFVPDYEQFLSGMNGYHELDIPLDNAFGEFTRTAEDATAALQRIVENGMKPLPAYAEKTDGFFFHYDNGQRDRVYKALMQDR